MRKYTLLLSVTVHVVAALALIIAPLFAAATLPPVRDTVAYVPATVAPPPTPPPPPPAGHQSASPANVASPVTTVPLTPPDGISPEAPMIQASGPPVEGLGGSNGVGVFGGVPGGELLYAPPVPVVKPPVPQAPVHIGGDIVAPRKVRDVAPIYPAIALAARTSGTVILEAVIAEDGRVRDVKVLRSVPLLDQAAMAAVRQWRFTPTLLSGQPVPVVMTVTVNFQLN